MDLISLALFIPACFALNMVPGPNNLLAMSNAQRFGFKYALVAGIGRLAAFVIMIFLAATGLAAVLYTSEALFFTIKVAGALYLFWVAYNLWGAKPSEQQTHHNTNKNLFHLVKQEFLLAAGNPKAILIFTAFLPQFIDSTMTAGIQFTILGVSFLCLEFLAIAIYASFGVYLKQWFSKPSMRRLFNRCCALFISSIGLSLLIERKN